MNYCHTCHERFDGSFCDFCGQSSGESEAVEEGDKLRAQVEELEAEVERLREDSKMLDWYIEGRTDREAIKKAMKG